MIDDFNDFEKLFVESFGYIDRATLVESQQKKLRLELGADESDSSRIKQASSRSKEVVRYCFQNMPFWLRIILWSESEEENLELAGLSIKNADIVLRQKNADEEILYLYFKEYSSEIANVVITSIIKYEMSEEPSANITCYFINFEKLLIVNIYDDRGLDIYSPDKRIINDLSNRFSAWCIAD